MYLSRTAAVALVSMALLPALSSARDPKLKEYTSDEGRFTVLVPGKVSIDKPKILAYGQGDNQVVKVVTERFDTPRSYGVFTVTYTDYPASFKDVPAKTIIDGVRDGMKGEAGLEGKLESEKDVTIVNSSPQVSYREIKVKAGSNVVRSRIYLVDTRLYQVTITGNEKNASAAITEEFFNSFKVTR